MKLNLQGNKPLILPRDPESPMEAANKNYVDASDRKHAADMTLHLTPEQNTWLDAITVTAEEVNAIAGIGGNIADSLAAKLNLAGGTMTGALYLSGDPLDNNQAATKQYVDTQDSKKVSKAGDAMTGFLTLHSDPTSQMHAATKQYVDQGVQNHASDADVHVPAGKADWLRDIVATATEMNYVAGVTSSIQTQLDGKLDKTGGTLTGTLTLAGLPTATNHAATKQYVDNQTALKLSLTGGTLTGPLTLAGDPSAPAQAANKAYVDATVQTHAGNSDLHVTPEQNELLDSLTVTAADLNKTAGLTDTVMNLLGTKLDKAGGTLTGDLTLAEGKAIFASTLPAADNQLVNKAYVDSLMKGQEWRNPITAANLVSATVSTPPADAVENDVYIVGPAATGAWAGKEGYAMVLVKGVWKPLQERAVIVGDRFGVALTSATALTTELEEFSKGLVTVTATTLGAMTFEADTVGPRSTTLVFDRDAPDFGVTYSVNDAGVWVPTNTSVNITAGNGLDMDGNTMSVQTGKAIEIVDDKVALKLASGSALDVNEQNELELQLDSAALVKSEGKLTLAPAVKSALSDAVSKSGSSSVTGTVVFAAGSTLRTVSAPVDGQDVPNKAYVDGVDAGLRTDVDQLTTDVAALKQDPVTKQYVDTQDSKKLALAGGTLTGPLTLSGDPSSVLHAATKQYVDNAVKAHVDDTDVHLSTEQKSLLNAITVSATEINALDQVTGNIQTQLNARLPLAGGTLTGPLMLASDPVSNAQAATKLYVDSQVGTKVDKAGGTMTGPLVLSGDPTAVNQAATKQYVDNSVTNHANNASLHLTPAQSAMLGVVTVTGEEINALAGVDSNVQDQLDDKVEKSGDTMTGPLTLSGNPLAELHAAPKVYVDTHTQNKLNLAGGTMTGPLHLAADPVADTEAATKHYVDGVVEDANTEINTALGNRVQKAGDAMTGFLTLHSAPTADMHAANKKFVEDSITASEGTTSQAIAAVDTKANTLRTDVNALMADPVTKQYVDTRDSGRVEKAGDTMTGFLTLHSDPQSPMHAVTRQYVDAVAQGLAVKPAVRLATTENLAATYTNGSYGVNATLTGLSNGLLSVDNKPVIVGDRILVRVQDNALENGDYVVQQVGNGTTPFILKRVVTADESREIPSAFFYVSDGQTLKGTGWTFIVNDPVTFAIGVDAIAVNQFSGQGSLIAGAGLLLEGNTLSIRVADPARLVVTAESLDLAPTGVLAGTYTKVTVDGYGRVMSGANPTTLAGYGINDAQPLSQVLTNLSALTGQGLVVLNAAGVATTRALEVNGLGLTVSNSDGGVGNITISSNATAAATAGTLMARDENGNVAVNKITGALEGNASTATVLKDTRTFSATGDVTAPPQNFNGSGNVALPLTLTPTGVLTGTYTKVTVDEKGRITLGENPTTLEGYGIIDAATITQLNDTIDALHKRMDELHTYVMGRM